MSEGRGFARRVTLENLRLYAALLKSRRLAGHSDATMDTPDTELTSDSANVEIPRDPALAAAEALFVGESLRTGIQYSRPMRSRPEGRTRRGLVTGRSGDYRSAEVAPGTPDSPFSAAEALFSSAEVQPGSAEVLLMRVRPRRNRKQMQISMPVHQSSFMRSADEVVSAADGSRRKIAYNKTDEGTVRNTARFEAPEMAGMANPVARFKWVSAGSSDSTPDTVLQYEIFDADNSREGASILERLVDGIALIPVSNPRRLSHEGTVFSKPDRERAQWYRLDWA